ncbi:MAG: hypothetical protein IMF12_00435 [Proteobacteria bacterium]|nr:hypothetical protein [Pseudomonadota bacterium]
MIYLELEKECVCKKMGNIRKECRNEYTIGEQGKYIKLERKNTRESVLAIVIDGCIIKDNESKCDALFLYKKETDKYSFLVELKGAGDIEKAFRQLSYTRNNRDEYKNIIKNFKSLDDKKVNQKFVIVSNGMLSKPKLESLEKKNNIRVKEILHCEATTPIPDLKALI